VEELKTIISQSVSKGMKVATAAKIAGMSKSSYYYKHRQGKPGRKPTTHCKKDDGSVVTNQQVVDKIKAVIGQEFMENGYRKVMYELRDQSYIIGKKKTYRLMRDHRLLLPKPSKGKRDFVRYTQPLPSEPFEKLEMDIKYIYIKGESRNAYLLTVIDTFTRIALGWVLQYSIINTSVKKLIKQVIDTWLQDYRPPVEDRVTVTIRCDNDCRFVAKKLQQFLKENFIHQEFILPATPQQNAHIESFHSVVEQLVCKKIVFENLEDARAVFKRFYFTYNNIRTISSILYLPPITFLQEWKNGNIGLSFIKRKGRIHQKFFFRGQRPKRHSVPPEELYLFGHCKYKSENNNFANPSLNES